jgi:hypothetical protein
MKWTGIVIMAALLWSGCNEPQTDNPPPDSGMDQTIVDDLAADSQGETSQPEVILELRQPPQDTTEMDFTISDLSTDTDDTGYEPQPGESGAPCNADGECDSYFCIQTPDGQQCTTTCTEECPFDWQCVQHTPSLPDQISICVPAFQSLCRPCLTNAECWVNSIDAGERCVPYGPAGSFCGSNCDNDNTCPTDYSCSATNDISGAAVNQCVRPDTECTCAQWFADQGATTDCYVENEFGACTGERHCTAIGLTTCTAETPIPESCNSLDDDCDLEVDEDLSGGDCLVVSQYGTCPGTEFCLNGQLICEGDKAKAELCDGEDNDCDGLVDEDYPDTDKDGVADCLEADKDGDGIVDGLDNCPANFNPQQQDHDLDTIGDPCDPDDDNDQTADEFDCAPKDASVHPGAEEACDGKDNNCNYIVDEGFIDSDTDGWKDCTDDDDDNDGIPDASDCAPLDPQIKPGAKEVCDGLDNDCDFDTDEGFGDADQDGLADCIDDDSDGDDIVDWADNCPLAPNPMQEDLDQDGSGDACDSDQDGDSIPNSLDNCDTVINTLQSDVDDDDMGDACDDDIDGDTIANEEDNCLLVANEEQHDADEDGIGDACEEDTDGDGDTDDYDCAPLNPAANHAALEVCNGMDDNCDGAVDEDLGSVSCGLGSCLHTVDKCQDGLYSICNPFIGAEVEICDDSDNDCDGLVDEDLGTTTCGTGECWHTVVNCSKGQQIVCDPKEGASDEVCDGKDNDCDGLVDEELPTFACGKGVCFHTTQSCIGGQPVVCDPEQGKGPEQCDGLDNDCDEEIDEDLGSTTCGFGECAHTVDNCSNGSFNICNPFDGVSPESCDLKDNDCDGLIDEDLGNTTCGVGQCFHTIPNCIDGQTPDCNTFEGATDEVCDGKDNDCDGSVDDGLGDITCGLGQCEHSVPACSNGIAQICNPLEGTQPESCDKIDNDCNGLVDDALGTTTCGQGICEHTIDNCATGAPQICNPLEGAGTEICDELDNNCDGITDPEDSVDCTTFYQDLDTDGFGGGVSKCLCAAEGNYDTETGGDCDDLDIEAYPSDNSICGKDADCDGAYTDAGEECDDGNTQSGDGCSSSCAIETLVFSEVGLNSNNIPHTFGTINGLPGRSIKILKIGICGDSDSGSGANVIQVTGGGLNFTWEAGQNAQNSTYVLDPTPTTGSGSERGFSYQTVNHVANEGQTITIKWTYHYDWDGRFCSASDTEGNSYNDPAYSIRSWILYTYE